MFARDARRVLALAAALGTLACARNPAPAGFLPSAEGTRTDPFGAWIVLELKPDSGAGTVEVSGELIAVQADSVFVLGRNELTAVPAARVRRATIAHFDNPVGDIVTWGYLGTGSTLSHGVFLLLSAPVWILASTGYAAAESRRPLIYIPDATWPDARAYARFPQGMPPEMDRLALRPRPLPAPTAPPRL